MQSTRLAVLVTGATGYIGGRRTPRLSDEGHRVRVLAREIARRVEAGGGRSQRFTVYY